MYAVVKTGGKQYRVQEGDTLRVEKLDGKVGDSIGLAEVLFIGDVEAPKLGKPTIGGARALLGELIQIKPVLVIREGQAERYEQQRTRRRSIARSWTARACRSPSVSARRSRSCCARHIVSSRWGAWMSW